jgi:ABC-2 type transport system ATP-binding protein
MLHRVMLELRNLSKQYLQIPAVDDVSFIARAGEVTGYLGPNGSGKSTTIKMVVGLIGASAGQILFDGRPIDDDLIGYKKRLGYVPEEPYLYTHLSGWEYLVMVSQLRSLPVKKARERIGGLLHAFGLYGDREVLISSYSKGMRNLSSSRTPLQSLDKSQI